MLSTLPEDQDEIIITIEKLRVFLHGKEKKTYLFKLRLM